MGCGEEEAVQWLQDATNSPTQKAWKCSIKAIDRRKAPKHAGARMSMRLLFTLPPTNIAEGICISSGRLKWKQLKTG